MANFIAGHNLHSNKIHIIGHGMGAHIAGLAGKELGKIRPGYKIARITALDPAGPVFFFRFPFDKLSKDDAVMVDALHTDPHSFGSLKAEYRVDFYANPGLENQPGCPYFSDIENSGGILLEKLKNLCMYLPFIFYVFR